MIPAEGEADVFTLVAAARRDLQDVEWALARGDDCLVALAVLARAARRADDAVFALLDARAASEIESVVYTHRGYASLDHSERRSP